MGLTFAPHLPSPYQEPVGTFYDILSSGVQMAVQERLQYSTLQASYSATGGDVQVTSNVLPQNEPSISVNPSNPQELAVGVNDISPSGFPWLSSYTSSDGGFSWTGRLINKTGVLASFELASDPALAFDTDGNLYYAGLVFNVQGNKPVDGSVFVTKSINGGKSFISPILAAPPSKFVFNDKPYIAVDETTGTFNGRVYVSWTRFTSSTTSDIMVASSSNGGLSFSVPVMVSTTPLNQGSLPIVGPAGELYVVWNDLTSHSIMEAKSTDGGVSFSKPVVVSSYVPLPSPPNSLPNSLFKVNNNPTAAVDDTDGNVYVAWADYGSGNADVLFSRSLDGGATWSPPARVNDDTTTNDQFFPWMTVSSGRLSMDWYDRRLDPSNHLMDVFYAQSTDGGATFTPNVRVTGVSSDPDGLSFIGDYIGIASNATVVYPIWTDLRNVNPTSPGDEDIFIHRIVDHPPTLDVVGDNTVDEGKQLTFQVRASDPDPGEILTLKAQGLPSGATFTSATSTNGTVVGAFSWTPSEAQGPGNYSVEIIASDGFFTRNENVSIRVYEVNSPPVLSFPGPQTVNEGSTLSFTVSATDPDIPAETIAIFCGNCAALGATFDPATGAFSWTPVEAEGTGDYNVTLTATDSGVPALPARGFVSIHVSEAGKPVLLVPPPQTVEEGSLLIFTVNVTSPDGPGDIITLSCDNCATIGATFDPDLGVFSWTPSQGQAPGVYTVSFTAIDDGIPGLTVTKTVTVTVTPARQAAGPQDRLASFGVLRFASIVLLGVIVAGLLFRLRQIRRKTSRVDNGEKQKFPASANGGLLRQAAGLQSLTKMVGPYLKPKFIVQLAGGLLLCWNREGQIVYSFLPETFEQFL